MESTVELPRHYTLDSIFMDVMADPKAKEILMPIIRQTMEIFSHEEHEGTSEAAKEAVKKLG